MNLRLVKIFLPLEKKTEADEILRKASVDEFWHDRISDKKILIRALVAGAKVEGLLDAMEEEFAKIEDFRVVILPVEASIPRNEEKTPKQEDEKTSERISREELYSAVSANSKLTVTYLVLVILASIVGAVGMVGGNVPMIVGAMIIAPLLGPAVGLSLGTILGDFKLTWEALKTMLVGIVAALVFSTIIGMIFPVDPHTPEIAMRTVAGLGDVFVSLASGSVGALAFTTGTLTSLAGVMVAVSLLPPLIAVGMLLGAGLTDYMIGALLLLVVNLICVNLAAVLTFMVQRISPRTQWQTFKAWVLTGLALLVWFLLLIGAVVLILVY